MMASLGQGHETANASYQTDGLRDTDVLASPTLTNFNQRALLNGVIPLTLNAYNSGTRNNTASGNCACEKQDYKTIDIKAGTVIVDGVIHTVAARDIDITTSALYATHSTHSNFTGLNAANEEAILLVYFDPAITSSSGKIGLICGTVIDTSSGVYPSSPSAHLSNQTVVLASARLHYANSRQEIASLEDKRVFARPGPLTLSSVISSGGVATSDVNSLISGSTGNMPITDLGFLFARDPAGLGGTPDGAGQTHLFFQSDQLVAAQAPTGPGGAYQITPVHRTAIKTDTWTGGAKTVTLLYDPLASVETTSSKLVQVMAYDTSPGSNTKQFLGILVQGQEFTVSNNVVTINTAGANIGYGDASHIEITYTHAGHT